MSKSIDLLRKPIKLAAPYILLSVIGQPVRAQQPMDSLLADTARSQLFEWCYPGGEMEPAKMRFWSNGLVELETRAVFGNAEKRYLVWSYVTSDSSELRLVFLDPRMDFETFLSVERTHTHISGYDEKARSITYKTLTPTHDAIFFGNWRFDRRYCNE
jgi:hypothetical protein